LTGIILELSGIEKLHRFPKRTDGHSIKFFAEASHMFTIVNHNPAGKSFCGCFPKLF